MTTGYATRTGISEAVPSEGLDGRPLEQNAGVTPEKTFSDLVEQYSSMAYNISLRMLRNPEDAEDAVQEAFLLAHRSLSHFKGQSKMSTWLYRIVVNSCLMKIRKEQIRGRYLSSAGYEDLVVPDWDANPEKAAVNSELRNIIQVGLNRLPQTLRVAVVLRSVQGFSNVEAAKILGITVPALKARLHRGHLLLRKYLEGYRTKPTLKRAGA